MNTLYSLADLNNVIDLGPLNNLLDRLFGELNDVIEITDFFENEENGVRSYTLVLAVQQSLYFHIPGLNVLSLGIIRDNEDEWPLILSELVVEGAPMGLTIRHFPLRIGIDNPYLLPVPIENESDTLDGFSFEVEGTFSVNTALELRAELESFSIPPFSIANTGLILGLDDCQIITTSQDVSDSITDLGFNSSFRGIYAASAQFYWDIPIVLEGITLPGLHADLEQLAIGNQGLSVDATLNWDVEENGQQFNANNTELLGSLFDSGWQLALEQLNVIIQANNPLGTTAIGYLRIPFFDTIIKAELGYHFEDIDTYRYHAQLTQKQNLLLLIPLSDPNYLLEIQNLELEGQFDTEGNFSFKGQISINLDLPGLNIQAESVEIEFDHQVEQDSLLITLDNITIDGFGEIEQSQLVLVFVKNDNDQHEITLFELIASMQWQDISDRIELGDQADLFPLPPDDAEINVHINWQENDVNFSLQAELDDVHQLWRFIPENMRPEVDEASIEIKLSSTQNNGNNNFEGELSLGFLLRLPDLATFAPLQAAGLAEMIVMDAGNDEGWMHIQFKSEINNADNTTSGKISASLENPIALTLQLPGMILPDPPVHISIDTIGINLSEQDNDLSGIFSLKGNFELHPILADNLNGFVPPIIAQELSQLLSIAKQIDLSGEANLTLGISADNVYFKTECTFEHAELELDLFDMLSSTLSGSAALFDSDNSESGTEIDLDIDVTIALEKISLSVGHEQRKSDEPVPFSFGIISQLAFAGQQAEMAFELSNESFSFGFNELTIPIAIPKLPLSLADLDRLKDSNNTWDYDNIWLGLIEPEISTEINTLDQSLEDARDELQNLQLNNDDENTIFQLEFRTIPAIQNQLFQLAGRKFMYQAVLAVHQMLRISGVENSQNTYQQGIEIYQAAVDSLFGSLHFDTQMQFQISDAKFVLPFNDPSDIRVEGSASIIGLTADDPLAPLGDLAFKLGISADAIYFAVEGGANPIPLPDFGRYPGSAVNLDRLIIGYGYSKNSLKIDFSGELILSEQLIEDAETSSEIGFGIALPHNNKLQFKLDLIPIVLGEIDFLIPLVAFDIDLRSDVPPPPPALDGQCNPAWDGLQLIIPDIVQADIKRFKVSPFFGPMPALNVLYSFDFEIGHKDYGLSYICSDYFYINPLLNSIPIPFLADSSPFFNRFCANLQLGGFGLSFDLTRPFPNPSPLLIFELMGFISDPSVAIDPNGHIANLMYAELYNARISLPPAIQTLFPALNGMVNVDYSGKINIATVIALAQQAQDLADQLVIRLENNTQQTASWIENLVNNPPTLSLENTIELFPDELRVIHLDGRFVFFDASVTFVLALAKDINDQLGDDQPPVIPFPTPASKSYELSYENNFNSNDLSEWKAFNFGLKQGKGIWKVENNQLTQDHNVGDNSPAHYGAMLVHQGMEHTDFRLLLDASSNDNDGIGLVFHVQEKDTFYRFRMTEEQKQWSLTKLVKGKVTLLFDSEDSFQQNTHYQIRIEVSSQQTSSRGLKQFYNNGQQTRKSNIDIDKLLVNRKEIITQTSIKVWVNDHLWCNVKDKENALSKGYIGLDSWWNNAASFDNLKVYKCLCPEISLGQNIPASQLQPLANNLSTSDFEISEVFADFNAQDIAVAMAGASDFAVAVTARVKVFGDDIYKMLGTVASDGNFLLMTSTAISPVNLSIAGIDFPLEVDIQGRMTLQGRSAGADSYAKIEANVYGDWILIPSSSANNAVARLQLASELEPASLSLSSNPDFSLKGHGDLQLFSQQILVSGEVDISQSHIMIAGDLSFKPEIFLFTNTRLMDLTLSCQGRVGPGQFIDLEGEGNLILMGKQFSHLSARVSNQLIELSASLGGNNQSWQLGTLSLTQVQMQLNGQVSFKQPNPAFAFTGDAEFEIFGAAVEGSCRIEADHQHWLLANSGTLFWQGRNWLDGAMVLSNEGVQLSGKADFGLDLTPTRLPANINIAGLYLNASISGKFNLNSNGVLVSWAFDLDWQLSIKLPNAHANQALPIATQHFNVSGSSTNNNDLIELIELINITDLTLFDLGDITIPVPTIDLESGQGIYLHQSLSIDPDGTNGLNFSFYSPVPPNFDYSLPADRIEGVIPLWRITLSKNLSAVELPVPVLSDEPENINDDPLFNIPSFDTTNTTIPMGQLKLENINFKLTLAWENGALGILLKFGNEPAEFITFSSVPNLTLGHIFDGLTFPVGLNTRAR